MNLIGYSTGAVSLGDFAAALSLLAAYAFSAVELSALRIDEVGPLIKAVPHLDLLKYRYVSFHAPSSFEKNEEVALVATLAGLPEDWPIVVHPDAIHDVAVWRPLSHRLAIENMDKRKGIGRSVDELDAIFLQLPHAKMCLDLGHARQVDSSMVGAYRMLRAYSNRIVQLHVSEVDTSNHHQAISPAAELSFQQVRSWLPMNAAFILESRTSNFDLDIEAEKVCRLFS